MKISISGIRGIFGRDLMLDDVINYSKRFAGFLHDNNINNIVIARDTRYSSKIIQDVSIATLLTYSIKVHNLGIAPTPFVFREARDSAGLMITSSHNPLEWNGLKFIIKGRGLFEDEFPSLLTNDQAVINIRREEDISSNYINEMPIDLNNDARVAIDTTGGAANSYADQLLEKIGCKVYSLQYTKPDYPDPTTKDLTPLYHLMKANNCKIGFAYDLDGDRLVVMHKDKLKPDATLLLCIANMSVKKFAVSIDTSLVVRDLLDTKNASLIYSKVGEANLIKTMLENDIVAGGEGSSGGFVYTKFNMCRDGLLASTIIASILDSKEFDECLELASKYHTIRTKISAPSNLHADIIDTASKKLERDSYSIDRLDGIKGYIDDHTWILIRSSNTEDIIRLSIESDDVYKVRKLLKDYEGLIKEMV